MITKPVKHGLYARNLLQTNKTVLQQLLLFKGLEGAMRCILVRQRSKTNGNLVESCKLLPDASQVAGYN